MNPFELQLISLINLVKKQKLRYAIIGGVAVSLYGEPRFTADIDVNVLLDKSKIKEFLNKSKKYGFYPSFSNTEKFARKTGIIPLQFKRGSAMGKCDIIIAENVLEYMAIRRGRAKRMGPIRAKIVSPEDLIIHKITSSRPRDIEDLKSILIRQQGKLDLKYIRNWLKKIDKANPKSHLYTLFNKLIKEKV